MMEKLKISEGKWEVSPKRNTYCPAKESEKMELKSCGLPVEFEAISIGTKDGQIAIIPLDESSEANAQVIVKAVNNTYGAGIDPEAVPDMIEAFTELLESIPKITVRAGQEGIIEKEYNNAEEALKKAEVTETENMEEL